MATTRPLRSLQCNNKVAVGLVCTPVIISSEYANYLGGKETTPMCGILGYFRKNGSTDTQLGTTMLNMLQALGRRGPDSAAWPWSARPRVATSCA